MRVCRLVPHSGRLLCSITRRLLHCLLPQRSRFLRRHLVSRTVIIAVAAAIFTGLVTVGTQYYHHRRDKFEAQLTLARSAAETVDMFFEQPRMLLSELGARLAEEGDPAAALQRYGSGSIQRNPYIDALVLLDDELRVTSAVPAMWFPKGYDLSGYRELEDMEPPGLIRMSLAGIVGDTGFPRLFMAYRLPTGVLVGYYRLEVISSLLQEVVVSDHTDIAVIDGSGIFAVHTEFTKVQQRQREPLYTRIFHDGRYFPAQELVVRDGRSLLVSAYPVQGAQWSVLTYEAFSPLLSQLLRSLLYGLAAIAAAALVVGLLTRRAMLPVLEPLSGLTERLQAVAGGITASR